MKQLRNLQRRSRTWLILNVTYVSRIITMHQRNNYILSVGETIRITITSNRSWQVVAIFQRLTSLWHRATRRPSPPCNARYKRETEVYVTTTPSIHRIEYRRDEDRRIGYRGYARDRKRKDESRWLVWIPSKELERLGGYNFPWIMALWLPRDAVRPVKWHATHKWPTWKKRSEEPSARLCIGCIFELASSS